MSPYGIALTRKGQELIAEVLSRGRPLILCSVMMGTGICPEDVYPGDLEDLLEPVAEGTSNIPGFDGETVHLVVEFRSDLNGGLDHDVEMHEFGVFARDGMGHRIMLLYASLGDRGQTLRAAASRRRRSRRRWTPYSSAA